MILQKYIKEPPKNSIGNYLLRFLYYAYTDTYPEPTIPKPLTADFLSLR